MFGATVDNSTETLRPREQTVDEHLAAIAVDIWSKLETAAREAADPWHLSAVATLDREEPRVRAVVLRGVDPAAGTIRLHTDSGRSNGKRSSSVRSTTRAKLFEQLRTGPPGRAESEAGRANFAVVT